jgi:hypothetical protein
MQILLMIVVALHVLPAVFWAGSTFVLARAGGVGAESLAYPQLGSAAATVIMGAVLWNLTHGQSFETAEQILAVGAASALVALGVQAGVALPAARRLANDKSADTGGLRNRVALGQRLAAGLLVIAILCMALARYI